MTPAEAEKWRQRMRGLIIDARSNAIRMCPAKYQKHSPEALKVFLDQGETLLREFAQAIRADAKGLLKGSGK